MHPASAGQRFSICNGEVPQATGNTLVAPGKLIHHLHLDLLKIVLGCALDSKNHAPAVVPQPFIDFLCSGPIVIGVHAAGGVQGGPEDALGLRGVLDGIPGIDDQLFHVVPSGKCPVLDEPACQVLVPSPGQNQ